MAAVRSWMVIVTCASLVLGGGCELLLQELRLPMDKDAVSLIDFEVRQGQTVVQIAARLKDARLIRRPALFRLMLQGQGGSSRLQAGRYQLSSHMTMRQIIGVLQAPPHSE